MKLLLAGKYQIPAQNESHNSALFTTDLTSSFCIQNYYNYVCKYQAFFATLFYIHLYWMYKHEICKISRDFGVPHTRYCMLFLLVTRWNFKPLTRF